MPPTESGGFRRVLFHGRPAPAELSPSTSQTIETRPFRLGGFALHDNEVAVLLLDPSLTQAVAEPPPPELGSGADRVGLLLIGDELDGADSFWKARLSFSLPRDAADAHVRRAIAYLFRMLEDRAKSARARLSLSDRTQEIRALVDVGVALSAERDPERLLEMILTRARALTQADAGSLYLVEESGSGSRLRFALAQNDSVAFEFSQRTMPLDDASIAGYVARHGEVLNLPDVSTLPQGAPYRFDSEFDRRYGYRTRSMLAVPMRTPGGRTLGVLQLLNRKVRRAPDAGVTSVIRVEIVPFDAARVDLARSLAAQAAVAVENRRLTESIRKLFGDFVEASVHAIEQRDPTTAGHSHRVAALAVALAERADAAESGTYASFRIGREELRELRYAALLHDFGKVGVREQVLTKAKKLPPGGRELIRARIDQAILSAAAEAWENAARKGWSERQVAEELARRWGELEGAWKIVSSADEPTVLPEEVGGDVGRLREMRFRDAAGHWRPIVEPEELQYLAIAQGSLNARERLEIESHVTQTFRFLSKIPWTSDLARIPEWAYAHHEKLDGSGYPRGLSASAIPIPVRILTICDIYDALAARDRPYKKALPDDRAIEILRAEARRGAIDGDLLELFVSGRVHERIAGTRG